MTKVFKNVSGLYLFPKDTRKEEYGKKMGDKSGSGQGRGDKGAGGSGKMIVIIVVIALVVIGVLTGVIIFLLAGRKDEAVPNEQPAANELPAVDASEEEMREVLVTEDNVQEVAERLEQQEYVPQGYYTVTQNYEWHFPKGSEASTDAHVENVAENTNDVYFDLFLEDDLENPIYKSPVIPLGAVLEGFKLDTELDAGTYDCIMVYNLVDENQKSISTVSMTVKVIVEK